MTRVTDDHLDVIVEACKDASVIAWLSHDLRDARARIKELETGRANDDRDYRRDVAHIAALERDLAASRKIADQQMNYAVKLQQLIENLNYDTETPHSELHHHKMIVAAKAQLSASRKEAAVAAALLIVIVAELDAEQAKGLLLRAANKLAFLGHRDEVIDAHLATYADGGTGV